MADDSAQPTGGENLGAIFQILQNADRVAQAQSPYAPVLQGVAQLEQADNPLNRNPYTGQYIAKPGQAFAAGLVNGLARSVGQGLQNSYVGDQDKAASQLLNQAFEAKDPSQLEIPAGMNPSVFNSIVNGASIFNRGFQQQQEMMKQRALTDAAAKVAFSPGAFGMEAPGVNAARQFLGMTQASPVKQAIAQAATDPNQDPQTESATSSLAQAARVPDPTPAPSIEQRLQKAFAITGDPTRAMDLVKAQLTAEEGGNKYVKNELQSAKDYTFARSGFATLTGVLSSLKADPVTGKPLPLNPTQAFPVIQGFLQVTNPDAARRANSGNLEASDFQSFPVAIRQNILKAAKGEATLDPGTAAMMARAAAPIVNAQYKAYMGDVNNFLQGAKSQGLEPSSITPLDAPPSFGPTPQAATASPTPSFGIQPQGLTLGYGTGNG